MTDNALQFTLTIQYVNHNMPTGLGPVRDFIIVPKRFDTEEDAERAVKSIKDFWSKNKKLKSVYISHVIGEVRTSREWQGGEQR